MLNEHDGSKKNKGIDTKINRNRFSILNDFDKTEYPNNNMVVNRLGSNIVLREKNEEFCKKAAAVEEAYKIEKITNNSLQILLAKYMNETDLKTQQLKTKNKNCTSKRIAIEERKNY